IEIHPRSSLRRSRIPIRHSHSIVTKLTTTTSRRLYASFEYRLVVTEHRKADLFWSRVRNRSHILNQMNSFQYCVSNFAFQQMLTCPIGPVARGRVQSRSSSDSGHSSSGSESLAP